ncbi:MAG: alpha-galactosidase [Planctomycetota bacterium]|nr:alpha-galactosidase [Planctomycetota bacterium]
MFTSCWFLPLLAFVAAAVALGAAEPESRITVSSEDTIVQVEARANALAITSLKCSQTGFDWIAANAEPLPLPLIQSVEVDGKAVPLRWQFKQATVTEGPPKQHVLVFVAENPPLELRSIWTAAPGPGPVEHSITIKNTGGAPVLLPLQKSLALNMQATPGHTLEQWWVEKGSNTPTPAGTHRTPIGPQLSASLVSHPYDREKPRDPIPWSSIQDVEGRQGFYVGIESSALVRINVQAAGENERVTGLSVGLGLGATDALESEFRTRLAPGESFEAPAVFVGCYKGDVDDGANRLRRWVEKHVRPQSQLNLPLLTNNSWGSGMRVDDKLARQMIDSSVEVGLENFHVDAGWFRGVGNWHPDDKKFAEGLAPIADAAHAKGLKFGLWIGWTQGGHQPGETGKGDVLSVNDPAMKSWFTRDYPETWRNSDFTGATACLADPKAEEWCLRDLRRCVKEYKLDLLEHDQVMIVEQCSRDTHRHTKSPLDVAYHAARGYYRVYDTLRAENPNLLFENCVNGGHMVDYGVVRRTHYISITDTYDPISNRRAFYDTSYAMPASMCECYVANHPGKTLANFVYMLRSGMMGWCTIMLDMSKWTPEQRAAGKKQFDIYKKTLRPLINNADLYHVSERPDGQRWDGMLYVDAKAGKGVLFAFRGKTADDKHVFTLKGLDPAARYQLTFEDGSSQPSVQAGAELMQNGVTVTLGETESSELVHLKRQ